MGIKVRSRSIDKEPLIRPFANVIVLMPFLSVS